MRANLFRLLCCLMFCAAGAAVARAQDDTQPPDDGIQMRGAFLTTRPGAAEKKKPAETAAAPAPTPAKPRPTGNVKPGRNGRNETAKNTPAIKKGGSPTTPGNSNPQPANPNNADYKQAAFSPAAIGIGYTLYMKDANGDAVRADPGRIFRSGEAVRISLEANTDGFLYIFYTENEGEPQMIFPDARLQRGNNFVRAHVPYEVPSNMESDERLRWFVFDATPATEHVYLVVTREPLPDVPTGETLVSYCLDVNHSCPWTPSRALWAQLTRDQPREQVAVSQIKDEGRAQTQPERDATTRGLGLAADAPEPTVVRMNASSTTGLLITSLKLVHK